MSFSFNMSATGHVDRYEAEADLVKKLRDLKAAVQAVGGTFCGAFTGAYGSESYDFPEQSFGMPEVPPHATTTTPEPGTSTTTVSTGTSTQGTGDGTASSSGTGSVS